MPGLVRSDGLCVPWCCCLGSDIFWWMNTLSSGSMGPAMRYQYRAPNFSAENQEQWTISSLRGKLWLDPKKISCWKSKVIWMECTQCTKLRIFHCTGHSALFGLCCQMAAGRNGISQSSVFTDGMFTHIVQFWQLGIMPTDLIHRRQDTCIDGMHACLICTRTHADIITYIYIYTYYIKHTYHIIEGSLEAKLPAIWTDGESQKGEDKRWRKSEGRRCRCAKR